MRLLIKLNDLLAAADSGYGKAFISRKRCDGFASRLVSLNLSSRRIVEIVNRNIGIRVLAVSGLMLVKRIACSA